MKKALLVFIVTFCFGLLNIHAQQLSPVELHGKLSVKGNRIVDKNGTEVQLRGMSLFWSQWQGGFYNKSLVKWLKDDWCISVLRAAMAVDSSVAGYATNSAIEAVELNKIVTVVDAAIEVGIYVIVDFHSHYSNLPKNKAAAKKFFAFMAKKYPNVPNIMYEPWNEPINDNWMTTIKPFHEEIIDTIRTYSPDNIIICGSRSWSQRVDEAADNPINKPNIAYTLHYYANSHKQSLRDKASYALRGNIALFVTEYGTCDASGNTGFNEAESKLWWAFLDANKLSYCNWSVSNKAETASILVPNTSNRGNWTIDNLSESGKLVRANLLEHCEIANGMIDNSNEIFSTLHPNPFQHSITLKRSGSFTYSIIDIHGMEISKGNASEIALIGENLTAGVYTVKIEQNSKIEFLKIIKSNY